MQKIGLVVIVLLLAVAGLPVQALDCDIDISGVITLLEQAQAVASDNDAAEARRLMAEARSELLTLEAACLGSEGLTESLTVELGDDGERGSLTFNYPAGWLTGELGSSFPQITIASNTAALGKELGSSEAPPFAQGEAVIALGVVDTGEMGGSDLGDAPTALEFLTSVMAGAEAVLGTPSDPVTQTYAGHPLATVTFTGNANLEVLAMLVDMGQQSAEGRQQFVFMLLVAAPGELGSYEAIVIEMVESFKLDLTT